MPLPIALSHRLCQRMAKARREREFGWIRPDGKSQVTIEYAYGKPKRVHTVLMSSQHSPDASNEVINRDLKAIALEVIPPELVDDDTLWWTNPSGRFVIGGRWATRGLRGAR